MLSSFRFLALACCLFATLAWVSGCENKPVTQTPTETSKSDDGHNHSHDHDHDHSNMSLGDAAKEIVSLQTAIAEAFAANDPDKAHDPLHEVGHIIGVLEEAGKKASLSEADAAELKATQDALMDAFAKVDGAMHGDGETKYSDVAEQVDKSIATLKKLAKIE